jgi:hypothetical protein
MKASLDSRRWLFALLVCVALLGGGGTALARDIAVVVHPDVPVDNLSFAELRKIMLGDRQFWPSGQKVTLIVAEPVDPGRTLLLEKVYKMSEPAFRQYWIAKVFRGEVTEGPKVVLSSEGIQELVTPGVVIAAECGGGWR